MFRPAWFLLALVPLVSCATDGSEDKGEEEELLDESKEDSHRKPTDHGALTFGVSAASALTETERYHAWTFELSGDAYVEMTTSYAVSGQRKTDTVLYLYKEGPSGWGRYIARNDDYAGKVYSQLVGDYSEGRYRVIVKGHSADTMGKFKITVGCNGLGCAPPERDACVFGNTYHELFGKPALHVINQQKIYAADLPSFTDADKAKLVRAVKESSHTDVTTPEEAIARVDQGEMNVTWIAEPAAQRMFLAFEYGAGDNSYGAIFDRHDVPMVASIHDGDLYNCTVRKETCLLSDDWAAMRVDPAFVQTAQRTITHVTQLSTLERDQAMGAFRMSFPDVTSVTAGLSMVDGNQLDLYRFRHAATGTELEVFAYYAGDTSVGAIYYQGVTRLAGAINDLAIERCSFFAN